MKGDLYDLTTPFEPGMTHSAATGDFSQEIIKEIPANRVDFQLTRLSFVSHLGCHMDAPRHYFINGKSISDISVERLSGRTVVIDVRGKEPFGLITKEDVINSGFSIRPGDNVFFCTGWERYFAEKDPMFFNGPSLSVDCADYLVELGVGVVGTDLSTVDLAGSKRPPGFDFPIHITLLSHEILIIECMKLEEVVGKELMVWALPMLIKDCDGAPVRVAAIEL